MLDKELSFMDLFEVAVLLPKAVNQANKCAFDWDGRTESALYRNLFRMSEITGVDFDELRDMVDVTVTEDRTFKPYFNLFRKRGILLPTSSEIKAAEKDKEFMAAYRKRRKEARHAKRD